MVNMTFEQIPPPEHPAIRAAKTIKQMHLDTIAQINTGFVYYKKLENGDTQSCNQDMVEACLHQITLCDAIIDNSRNLPDALLKPVELLLVDAKKQIEKAVAVAAAQPDDIPEIGNYDHKAE
jgi:hypothetical protein